MNAKGSGYFKNPNLFNRVDKDLKQEYIEIKLMPACGRQAFS
jgi:hypothetical protein